MTSRARRSASRSRAGPRCRRPRRAPPRNRPQCNSRHRCTSSRRSRCCRGPRRGAHRAPHLPGHPGHDPRDDPPDDPPGDRARRHRRRRRRGRRSHPPTGRWSGWARRKRRTGAPPEEGGMETSVPPGTEPWKHQTIAVRLRQAQSIKAEPPTRSIRRWEPRAAAWARR